MEHDENAGPLAEGRNLENIIRTVEALRLFRDSTVAIGPVFHARVSKFFFSGGSHFSGGPLPASPFNKTLELTQADVGTVTGIYRALKKLESDESNNAKALHLAIRLFSSARDRAFQMREAFIDGMTAIESVLHVDKELGFKIPFRVAGLLGKTDDDRIATWERMAKLYQIRNSVVHGSQSGATDFAAELDTLLIHVRRLLRFFLELNSNGKLTKDLYRELDTTLQHEGRRRKLQQDAGSGN